VPEASRFKEQKINIQIYSTTRNVNEPQHYKIPYFYRMNTIRRQSIISTLLVFLGFGIGLFNTFFFVNKQWFTPDQYGLTRSFGDLGNMLFAFSFLGATSVIYKFYPYYNAHLKKKENDLLGWSLLLVTIAFCCLIPMAVVFKPFFIRKFSANSGQLVTWYYWFLPFGYCLLLYNVLEAYSASLKRTIITSFLKETLLRLLTSVLIILFILHYINFQTFIKLFVFLYGALALTLLLYLKSKNQLFLTLKTSTVTRKFKKKIFTLAAFVFSGVVIMTAASTFDSLSISSLIKDAPKALAVFALSSYISNIIQVPQRGVIAISVPVLSEAWREKKTDQIRRIYQRSSINLLLIGIFLFGNIWLCYEDVIQVFNMNPIYLTGKYVVFFLGLKILIDMGTGVNAQIIGTSNYWRFEFVTGIILLALIIPLNLYLVKKNGIMGAAISNLLAYSVYNTIRLIFLWKKFRMQPFSINTLWSVAAGIAIYALVYFTLNETIGWVGIVLKAASFSLTFIALSWYLKLSPDLEPVYISIRKRLTGK
jgi:O-antigen/teichoic acid export membrane protein